MRLSFTERMELGREIACRDRARGIHTGKLAAGWSTPRRCDYEADSWRWLVERERRQWRLDVARIANDFAAAVLSGADNDIDTLGEI